MSQKGFNLAKLDDNLQLKIFVYAIMTMERTEHGYVTVLLMNFDLEEISFTNKVPTACYLNQPVQVVKSEVSYYRDSKHTSSEYIFPSHLRTPYHNCIL